MLPSGAAAKALPYRPPSVGRCRTVHETAAAAPDEAGRAEVALDEAATVAPTAITGAQMAAMMAAARSVGRDVRQEADRLVMVIPPESRPKIVWPGC